MAWYSQGLSISVFEALGNFGRSFSLQSVETESWLHPRPVEARPDGTILSLNDPEGTDTAVVEIRDGEGALSASLGTHPNMIVFVETDEYGNRELSSPAYGPALRLAVWGELVVVGHTSRYEIRAFRADGSLARIVRRDDVLRAPVQADLGPFVEAQMSMLSESSFPAEMLPDARRSLTAAQSSASSTPPDGMDGFMMKSARVRRPTRAARASRSSRQPVEGSKAQGGEPGGRPGQPHALEHARVRGVGEDHFHGADLSPEALAGDTPVRWRRRQICRRPYPGRRAATGRDPGAVPPVRGDENGRGRPPKSSGA